MKCKNCDNELKNVDGKQAKQYCSDKCRKQFQRKNKDSAILSDNLDKQCPSVECDITSATPDNHIQPRTDFASTPDKIPTPDTTSDNSGQIANRVVLKDIYLPTKYDNVKEVESPAGWATQDCTCQHCQQLHAVNADAKLNHGAYMSADKLKANGYNVNRVALPGDADYAIT